MSGLSSPASRGRFSGRLKKKEKIVSEFVTVCLTKSGPWPMVLWVIGANGPMLPIFYTVNDKTTTQQRKFVPKM